MNRQTKFWLALIAVICIAVPIKAADVAISALPAATTLDGTEVFPIVQSSTTKKATINLIASQLYPSLTGTPAAGDLSYWTSSSAMALLTASSCTATNPILSGGVGAAITCGSVTTPTGAGTARLLQVIAEGATAHNFGNLATGACETITTAATGTASTDNIDITFNADISGTTGFTGAGTMLTLYKWPTANNINVRACNFTGGADINASSVTINWKVIR